MVYKILKFFISLSLFLSNVSFGQNDNILFLMDNVPSSKNVNIASFDDSIKFNFSVPLLSSIQTSLNSDFVYDNIIKRKIDNSKFIDTNSFLNSLTNKNEISFYSKFNLLRLGFKVKNDYIDISVDEKINFDLVLDSTSSERYPEYEVNLASSREDYFRELCEEGLIERYGSESYIHRRSAL